MKHFTVTAALFATAASLAMAPAAARNAAVLRTDSFRIGTSGVECSAQNRSTDGALQSMFDRAFNVVCRDAAASVGKLYILQGTPAPQMAADMTCSAPQVASLPDIPNVTRTDCVQGTTGLRFVRYASAQDRQAFLAEGLAGYDSALQLGFRSLVLGRAVPGPVEVAVTEAGDPSAFARIQAGNLDPDQALAEGYVRNNTGNFPEAAEFFDTLLERSRLGGAGFTRASEYAVNQALQLSNLGKYAEADELFTRALKDIDGSDPVLFRMQRNFRMLHALNQKDGAAAIAVLNETAAGRGLGHYDSARLSEGFLDRPIVQRINNEDGRIAALGGGGGRLSSTERAQLLDAQAQQLQGAALRLSGDLAAAKLAQTRSIERVLKVRGGKVASAVWLHAGALVELASLAEAGNDLPGARKQLDDAIALYRTNYPGSPALFGAQARLAALLARTGSKDEARTLFRDTVKASAGNAGVSANVRGYLGTYFDLLAADSGGAADFFTASQLLVRPGVAQTQAVFARELSGGSDEAARLFRLSLNQSRDLVRLDADIARLAALSEPNAETLAALEAARARRTELGNQQTALLSKLAEFPRFKAVSDGQASLETLQAALKGGEGYYKLSVVGNQVFALFVTSGDARFLKLGLSARDLEDKVAVLRDSIVRITNGTVEIDPFDVSTARALYLDLFGALDERVAGLDHLIFEPDGAMLQLPVNLLVADQKGLDAYAARMTKADADPYDFRGVEWLGRKRVVTTSVSPKAFLDVRAIPASRASRDYLGLGQNAPVSQLPGLLGNDPCAWPANNWGRPISADELKFASARMAAGKADLMIESAFSDTALLGRTDLRDFRIVHFATHGLVTAPRPQCPARPALVTSFGNGESDGLLTFREIFALELDADFIVLSACDTAGMADVAATRDAGIPTGGNFAMDGLVRAFVAAGARTVVASHWPVPDDFDATKTLMTGLFSASSGQASGEALRETHLKMMDNADTSHPYYWSGFAVIGDATRPITPKG